MKLTDAEFREHLVDFVYGTLDDDTRRACEACLAESESCRRELRETEETLGLLRGALHGALDEAPPARVRASVLSAAAEAARDAREAPLARLFRELKAALRTPWLLPTLGVAVAVILLVIREPPPSPRSVPSQELPAPPEREPAQSASSERASAPEERGEDQADGIGRAPERAGEAKGSGAAERRERARAPRGEGAKRESARTESAAKSARTSEPRAAQEAEAEGAEQAAPSAPAAPAPPPLASEAPAARAPRPPAPSAASTDLASAGRGEPSADADAAAPLLARLREQLAADRLHAALETYRVLLARFPDDPRAPAWRRALEALRKRVADAGP